MLHFVNNRRLRIHIILIYFLYVAHNIIFARLLKLPDFDFKSGSIFIEVRNFIYFVLITVLLNVIFYLYLNFFVYKSAKIIILPLANFPVAYILFWFTMAARGDLIYFYNLYFIALCYIIPAFFITLIYFRKSFFTNKKLK